MFRNGFLLFLILSFVMSCSIQKEEVQLVLDTKSELGEGAIWNHESNRLYWVDIKGKILNIYNPFTGVNKEMMTGQMIGAVVPSESGKAIVSLQKGIYYIDVETGSKKLIIDPEKELPDNRFNDGKCDPKGRFWAGTMHVDGDAEKGSLYKMNGDGTVFKMIENVSVSNGIVWSHDHTKMYYIDSPTKKVMAYDYNIENGEITDPKVAINISDDMGFPDGMTIDSEGNLWIALWGGFAVGCWNPETGELIRKIEVPAKNVTSCAFGDTDLGTLYITTAREGMNKEELLKYPLSGGVFKIRTKVNGVPAIFFKGDY